MPERRCQHVLGAVDVHRQDLVGVADVVLYADHRRQMVDQVGPGHEPFQDVAVQHRLADHPEAALRAEMAHLRVGGQVEHGDLAPPGQPGFGQMRAEEARPPGDEHLHGRFTSDWPGVSPRRPAQRSAGSSGDPASCTRRRSRLPRPVATTIP